MLIIETFLEQYYLNLIAKMDYAVKALLLAGVATSGLVIAYTISHYFKRRKYRHIKGPETKGFNIDKKLFALKICFFK